MTGLAPDDAYFDAELAGADASVDAVVSLYCRYDWTDRTTRDRDEFVRLVEKIVVRKSMTITAACSTKPCPSTVFMPGAPPFLVIHGDSDRVIPVEEARAFVTQLQATSTSAVPAGL